MKSLVHVVIEMVLFGITARVIFHKREESGCKANHIPYATKVG